MSLIKCKMCGADLPLTEGQSITQCEYCGSVQTIPKVDDEKKLTLFARANRLRAACEFDKAAGIYEAIVADFLLRDSGHAIENVVYFELLRRGYDVAIGKVDQAEVDFIATKAEIPGIGFRRSQGSFIYWWLCLCAQKLSSSVPLWCSRCRPATSHRRRCHMRHSRHRSGRCR